MLVELRMDPDQKIAAYRVVPQPNGHAAAALGAFLGAEVVDQL